MVRGAYELPRLIGFILFTFISLQKGIKMMINNQYLIKLIKNF